MNIVFIIVFVYFVIKFFVSKRLDDKNRINTIINTIVRGCARWGAASLQDKSPLVTVLHANYAAGYLWALKDVFSDIEIMKASGINIVEFQKKITDIQDRATKLLINVCPKYSSDIDIYLGKIGGE